MLAYLVIQRNGSWWNLAKDFYHPYRVIFPLFSLLRKIVFPSAMVDTRQPNNPI